ncbi:hypothetical protein EPUS_02877 [Endocarpon pusillum Z07020]|uniref:Uncharacterized protein n=1 Tax=Endocarpon pusillum (strain Z07020 / HMAS-L-300199) TaxID=1263415 RepID=U1HQA5_ENDPU|nr:uncharacterized protein EPUS_02877 [Endocarpon pusillum Z07020]ERF72595.1 hypothetical protein EPUS_02877 [Endocarpon pusillum Z07020]
MYMACKDNDCFPGELPVDDHDRNVSVHAILGGLGLLTDGMLPFNAPASPSEKSGSRRQSQSHVSSQPPRNNSGSCNPSMDHVDASTLNSTSALLSSNSGHSGHSARSSTSHHSFHNFSVSPNTQTHSLDSSHQSHDMGPPFLHNFDYLSFGSQNSHIPMVTLAGTNMNGTQLLRNDFFFPWPATSVAAMDTTGYHQ